MPQFKASDAVESLRFDFRPYADETGEVAEPTDDQVAAFYAGLGTALKDALGDERTAGVDLQDPEQVGRLFASLTADDHRAMYDQMLELHAAVCGEAPSRETLAALPYRLRQAWYGYVQGWLRPEASGPATKS